MLVYYYIPQGFSSIEGKQVHGYSLGMPPMHISYAEYLKYKSVLEMAPFTPSYIENRTGRPFPFSLSFTIDTLKCLQYRTLQKMATYFGVDALLPHTRLIYRLRKATRDL